MSLPSVSVRQPMLANLLFCLIVVVGIQVVYRLPKDLFPDMSFDRVVIETVWFGASPDEVERLVAAPIEKEIRDVVGVKRLFSFSGYGFTEIHIEWQESLSDSEQQSAVAELRAAVDRVDDLPPDAEQPIVTEVSFSEVYPVCMIAVSDVGGVDEVTLRETARELERAVERIPGVRSAELVGARDREIHVDVDELRAFQYDLTLAEIAALIPRNNENVAAGTFSRRSGGELTVRGLGHFTTARELAAMVARKHPDGTHIRLGEVADVHAGFEERQAYVRHNGHATILIRVSKVADADLIEVVDSVREFAAQRQVSLPDGIQAVLTWDTSESVAVRLGIMRSNLLLGIAAVMGVLWLTLGARNGLLAVVGIPFSFLTALIMFPWLDITINSLSLIGLVMVSGMLVDDAIIILENIYRRVEAGQPLQQAVIEGTEEVMWPVIAAVATTVAAFLPMFLVSGPAGEFMSILPKAVIVCLVASLFEALVMLPAHYTEFGRRQLHDADTAEVSPAYGVDRLGKTLRTRVDAGLEVARALFLRAQAAVLLNRRTFLVLCGTTLYFCTRLSQYLPVDLFPSDYSMLFVTVEAPQSYGIDQTNAVMERLEDALSPIQRELTDVSTFVGHSYDVTLNPVRGANLGALFVTFPDVTGDIANPTRVLHLVRATLEGHRARHPGDFEALRVMEPPNGPPIGRPVAIRVQAEDYDVAKQVAEKIKAELAQIAGVFNIDDNLPLGPRELLLRPDEYRASLHGLTFQEVGATLRAATDGLVPSLLKARRSDEDWDIRLGLPPDPRRSVSDLLDVELRSPYGYRIGLSDVARVDVGQGYRRLYRYDGRRAVAVYADVDGEGATSISVNREIQRRFGDVSRNHPGVRLIFGGEFEETGEAFADMGRAMFVAILAIYGILAVQTRSYLQPLMVVSVISFAYVGVVLGMWICGYALSMHVLYAVVGLAGVVVNESLVLLHFVSRERASGSSPAEAIVAASGLRFRPIALTTLTTIAGLAPMALGLGGQSRAFGPFAAAIVFGVAAASLFTLLLVPALYLLADDIAPRRSPPA